MTHKLNPHFAESLLYMLINESCKTQMIQLQEEALDQCEPIDENARYEQLKQNLLVLAERWSRSYDTEYESANFATQEYLSYERDLLFVDVDSLQDRELLFDLGCATGRLAFLLCNKFENVVGYDISYHMQARANEIAGERGLCPSVSFGQVDLECGIPMPDESVSFVVMNLGTASDMRNVDKVISETLRVLKPGGRFFFSFYNREALVYKWEFLPWHVNLTASINVRRDLLDVCVKDCNSVEGIMSVYAKAYTVQWVARMFSVYGVEVVITTHPTVSAILPHEILQDQPSVKESVSSLDRGLVDTSMGAYIIARGRKL